MKAADSYLKEDAPDRRLKVLVEAYECSPSQSHAPGSAWQILSRLAKLYDLWVITEETQYR
ncbi:MAG: hypothetical protein KAV87_08475, partial [Desulfobacteraceae bacterium]|nr:hypothetical protein [Desulfobacteraceae bacterium]